MAHGMPAWRPGNPTGRLRKVYPPEQVEYVRRAYAVGRTQVEIAAVLGTNKWDIAKLMKRNGLKARTRSEQKPRVGPDLYNWQGDDAGYGALHARVLRRRGRPTRCEQCGTTDPTKRYEWANLTGDYADLNDYKRMCRACHRRFDDGRAVNQKRCAQCGRVGTRDFRTIPATDETKPIVVCLYTKACRERRLKDCSRSADN